MASHGQHPVLHTSPFIHPAFVWQAVMSSTQPRVQWKVRGIILPSPATEIRLVCRLPAQLGLELSLPARCWTVCASSRRERRATGRLLVLIISFPCSRRTRVSFLAGWPTWLREAMQMKSSVTMSTYVWVSPASWHCYFRYWPCRDWWPAPGLLRLGCSSTRFYSRW